MALLGRGVLLTFTDVVAADEAELNEWYNREHIDERVNLPGFSRARRYAGAAADPRYFAIYECSSVRDLDAPGYLRLLANQTPWSRSVMRRFTRFERMTLEVRVDLAHGLGGAVSCVRFAPDPANAERLAKWLATEVLPKAICEPGMLGAFAGENDLDVATAPARMQGLAYPAQASVPEWAVIFEGGDERATQEAAAKHLSLAGLREFGVTAAPRAGTYRLVFANQR
jgi:hypothetical protein